MSDYLFKSREQIEEAMVISLITSTTFCKKGDIVGYTGYDDKKNLILIDDKLKASNVETTYRRDLFKILKRIRQKVDMRKYNNYVMKVDIALQNEIQERKNQRIFIPRINIVNLIWEGLGILDKLIN